MTQSQIQAFIAANPGKRLTVRNASGATTQMGATPQQPQSRGLVGDIVTGLVDPAARFVTGAAEQLRQSRGIGKAKEGGYTPLYMNQDEWKQYEENPFLKNVQNVAGLATYAVPGGGSVPAMIARGAIGGGLLGFSQASSPDDILTGITEGALTGGVVGGGLGLAGKAVKGIAKGAGKVFAKGSEEEGSGLFSRAAKKLSTKTESQEFGNFQRAMGAKVDDQRIMPSFKELGFTAAKDADNLVNMADSVISTEAPKLQPVFEQLDKQVGKVKLGSKDYFKIVKPLQETVFSKTLPNDVRQGASDALDTIVEIFKRNGDEVSHTQLYAIKQGLGQLKAKFGTTVTEGSRANAFRDAYFAINDLVDDKLKAIGFEDFRNINKNIHVANEALDYANKVGSKAMAGRPINLFDAITAAGGLTGGPAGFAGGALASKALQSRAAEGLVTKGMNSAANILEKIPKIQTSGLVDKVNKVAQSKAGQAAGGLLKRPIVQMGLANTLGSQGSDQSMGVDGLTESGLANTSMVGTQSDPTESLMRAQQMLGPGASSNSIITLAKYLDQKTKASATENDKMQLSNSLDEMQRLYGVGTNNSLSQGANTVGPGGLVSKAGQDIRKSVDQDYVNRLTSYKQMASLAAGILNKARGAGTLNAGEFEVMMQNIPNEYTSEQQASDWFNNARLMLARATSGGGSLGSQIDTALADNLNT